MANVARKLTVSSQEMGSGDSIHGAILMFVSEENYPRAIEELRQYLDSKPEYPQFKARSERYISYAIDLVNGIKTKRSFASVKHLAAAKQQELHDRAVSHFEDLKVTLKKVKQIEREVRLEDVRSTIWVVKALVHCTVAILVVAFVIEISRGILPSAGIVIDDFFLRISDRLFSSLGL